MELEERKYWPFSVLPVDEQTDLHKQEVHLLEEAYLAGYRPYVFGGENFGLGDEQARWIEFIWRGRAIGEPCWEPLLYDGGQHYPNGLLVGGSESECVLLGIEFLWEVASRWLKGTPAEAVYKGVSAVMPLRDRTSRRKTNTA